MAESIISQIELAASLINIPSGNQIFSSDGTFTAPYDGLYTVILNAPTAKTGSGGRGGSAASAQYNWGGVGGGGGGSSYKAIQPGIILINLKKDEQIPITVNTSISSFGSYASFSCGTAPGNGNSGGSGTAGSSSNPDGRTHGKGGAGGLGGGKPLFSFSKESIAAIPPVLPNANLTGGTGETASGQYYDGRQGAKGGVASSNIYGIPGQTGGWGQATQDSNRFSVGTEPIAPIIEASAGSITVIWGNS